jgi:VWFA-related protein
LNVRRPALLAATLLLTRLALAQTPEAQPSEPGPDATILQAGTKIVVLDVVVQDKDGKPVHGLKAANFQLIDGKVPQQIRNFEEHTPPPLNVRAPQLGPMPPGVFTDYTPVPPGTTLNVLLLDALNTPMMYQTWVRDQLKKYVKDAPPGQRIAIFGLTDELLLLQGFTSDPEVLKSIVDRKLNARASPLLTNPTGTAPDENFSAVLAGTPAAGNLAMFEEELGAVQLENRIQATLDAFNALARYLSAFPGRKNLLWFSGSFPTGVFPGPTDPHLLNSVDNANDVAETAAALTAAQVAIYPIDARGLMTDPTLNPANHNQHLTAPNARGISNDINAFSTSQLEEHATMEDLAGSTGGKAFYNTNGIVQAVQEAITSGSNYYTLSYSPADVKWNGAFRPVHVKLVDAPGDLKLTYRPGYYATAPRQPRMVDAEALKAGTDTAAGSHGDRLYSRTALTRGAPMPQDVLFKVRVLPASRELETKLAPLNMLAPDHPAAGPFHRYDLDFALEPTELTFTQEANGAHTGQVKFTVYVYDRDGHLLVTAHRGFNLNLKPGFYEKFIKAKVENHMEISVPDHTEAYLRIAVEDIPSDRFGVVEVPAAAVSGLAPPADYGRPARPKP